MRIANPAILFALAVLLSAGCGGSELELLPAGGTVTYNGQAVPNATVSFVPENGPMAIGVTDSEGRFTLKTGDQEGAVPGTCKVTIYAVEGGGATMGAEMPDPAEDPGAFDAAYEEMVENVEPSKSLVPEKYGNTYSTPLSYEIKSGADNQFEIQLAD